MYEDGKEEEDGLVDGGEVDPAVEADQEDQLDQQGGVDDGVGEARTKPEQDGEMLGKITKKRKQDSASPTRRPPQEQQQQQQPDKSAGRMSGC